MHRLTGRERQVLAHALDGLQNPAIAAALQLSERTVEAHRSRLLLKLDAPSLQGKKLYLIKAQTPVEVVVKLEGWLKVRDAEGTLAWLESRNLVDKRTLVVTAPKAEIRQSDKLDKWVAIEFIGPASPGWAKVRHRDGATGYIRSTQVWGL